MSPRLRRSSSVNSSGQAREVRILCLDGGGTRGIVPLTYLAYLEQEAGRPLRELFDLIVGSDVLYERDVDGGLAAMIECNARPVAEIWIVDPDRGNRGPFNRRMSSYGFAYREERLDCAATAQDDAYKGRLLVYCR